VQRFVRIANAFSVSVSWFCESQGCRKAPTVGLKLANAFGVGLELTNAFGVGLELTNAFGWNWRTPSALGWN
jgi:hypothetical protein